MTQSKSEVATIAAVAQLLAVVLTVASLFFARDVFIPLALGFLLSFLLSPIVNRLQRSGVSNVVAVVLTATLAFVLLAGVATLIGREVTSLVGALPEHREELVSKARSMAGMTTGVGGSLDRLAEDVTDAIENSAEEEFEAAEGTEPTDDIDLPFVGGDDDGEDSADEAADKSIVQRWTDKLLPIPGMTKSKKTHDGATPKTPLYMVLVQENLPLASWATTAGTMLGPFATAGLVCVIALFTLIHREDLRDRIIAVVSHGNYVTTTEAMDEAAGRISRYLIAQTIVNTSYGLVLTIGLTIIGSTMTQDGSFPNVILWGALATCLRFVPYIGPVASAIFPLTMAFAVFPGYGVFIAVAALIITMELLSNNILEPWLYGASTGISAVAVIFAAVFWGWLWGPFGLFLSTPLTVCLVVLGRYVPRFKMLAILLGEEVQIDTSMRFYQRLLASDAHRARTILQDHLAEHDMETTCDMVLIPALKRIRADHDAEHLSDKDANRLFALVGGLIEKLDTRDDSGKTDKEHAESEADTASSPELPTVIGCTSHHFSEALILNLLRIAGEGVYQLTAIDDETLPQDVGQQVVQSNPPVVVIVVLPKGGFAQARYLCKSIRSEGYRGAVVIACIGKFKNYDGLFVKFRKAGATSMTTSYSQTSAKIQSILSRKDPVPVGNAKS
ncbi:AI-2E family transporter [Allorhodopirellula heiligendammensis]|uniref:AI-2 transport protein TqsA n=1 Tax=Allorhodopirellula heiligendammensis TaxID=2714739 RepID=A0A5C6BY64_9BACT|nr:AI-2E family transporter [Allorhodopirellula heiligendammensis]TWU16597.1 AI-2 transport protein TqsA [Allorhodopirellula heiligendammensis]